MKAIIAMKTRPPITPPTTLPRGKETSTAFGCDGGALYAEETTGTVVARSARDTPRASASVLVPARFVAKAGEESCDAIVDAVVEPSAVLSAAAATNASIENPTLYPMRDASLRRAVVVAKRSRLEVES